MGAKGKRKKSKSSPENKGQGTKRVAIEKDTEGDQANCKLDMQGQSPINQTQTQFQTQYQTPCPSYQVPNHGFNNGAYPESQFVYTQPVNQSSPTYTLPPPVSPPPSQPVTSDQFSAMMARFDTIEKQLSRLDTIQSSVDRITTRLDSLDTKVTSLQNRVSDIENSRSFDSNSVDAVSRKQREIDAMLTNFKTLEEKQRKRESEMKSEIVDLKSRSMRDNLLFFGIPEERAEDDSMCVEKVLDLIESKCELENAKTNIKLHRAHRIGRFNPSKTRPIVAKFAYYQDRENVRKCANKLSRPYGISQQFPKEVMETRRRLIPIMKQAREENKEAFISVDKLYINGRLYREPEGASDQR